MDYNTRDFGMRVKDRDSLEEAFRIYDTIGDSKMDLDLLGEALRAFGLNPTEGEVNKLIKELSSSDSMRITFEEFYPIYQSLQLSQSNMSSRQTQRKADFISCFRVFDTEQNGTISVGELQHIMTNFGEYMTADEVNILTHDLVNEDGTVDIEEFVQSVIKG